MASELAMPSEEEQRFQEELNTDIHRQLPSGEDDMSLESYLSENVQEKEVEESNVDSHVETTQQLIIDEATTTLVYSKRKGINCVYRPYKKVFSIPTKDFCDKLDKSLSSSELLPRNVRYSVSSHKGWLLVLEEEPCIRSINVNYAFESDIENLKVTGRLEEFGYSDFLKNNPNPPYRFTLSFPYVVYVIQVFPPPKSPAMRVQVFYRNAPLTDLHDSLFKCNLLNVDENNYCCMGDVEIPRDVSLNSKVNIIMDSFWNSTFNREIRECYHRYEENPHLSSFLHWQYYSDKDPMFIMSENFIDSGKTVASALAELSSTDDAGRKILDTYRSVTDLLFSENDTHTVSENLYSVNQLPLSKNEGLILDSGEEVVLRDEKCYVIDFLRNDTQFKKIRIETQKGDVLDLNLTPTILKSLTDQIRNRKYTESITIKDQEIKPGKIIKFTDSFEEYTTVIHKILKDRDGNFLTKCGRDYYLLNNVNFQTFSEDQVRIRGAKLEKGKKYVIIQQREQDLPNFYKIQTPSGLVYNGLTSDSDDDSLCLNFGNDMYLEFDCLKDYNIFGEEEIERLEVARYGRRLIEGCSRVRGSGLFAKNIKSLTPQTIKKFIEDCITKQELLIQSYDFDIKFSVGDRVVIPDWSNTETLNQIRTITGFSSTANLTSLDVLSVKDGDIIPLHTRYIDFPENISKVNIGSVRKISDEFDGIKAGFKMIAKSRGIQNFMKKDCYKVIGFITDTGNGIPLMLCSNLCTVWCTKQDLEKFDFFTPESFKFNRLEVSQPSLDSIAFQPGDLIFSNRSRTRCCDERVVLVLIKPGFGQMISVVKPDSGDVCKCYRDVINPISFYGIPSPRIKFDQKVLAESSEFERVTPYPGFHNTIFDVTNRSYSNTKIYIRREEKSNVSNLLGR